MVTDNNSERLESLCDVTGSHNAYDRRGNLLLTCNVHTAFTLKVCNEKVYHRVKLTAHIKSAHGVNVGKKYMYHNLLFSFAKFPCENISYEINFGQA